MSITATLWTRDETREAVVASAVSLALVEVPAQWCRRLLYEAGPTAGLAPHEKALVNAHARVLDAARGLGYEGEATEELDGIASVIGLAEDVCDWEALFGVVDFVDPDETEVTSAGGRVLVFPSPDWTAAI